MQHDETKVTKYRKKPVAIHAVRWVGTNRDEIEKLLHESNAAAVVYKGEHPDAVFIPTLEGEMRADMGDFIVRGIQGELYPCKPDIFRATNEPFCPLQRPRAL